MRAMPPNCQMCGSKEGSVVFMDLWVLCPECWVAANGAHREAEADVLAEEHADDELDRLADAAGL